MSELQYIEEYAPKINTPVIEADERPALTCPDDDATNRSHLGEHFEKLV